MNDQDIGYLMKQITDRIKISADADFIKRELTLSQANVLGVIHSQGGKITQKQIENHMSVAHPTVVGIVSRLEKNGFLTCYFDAADKRNKIVCLTEKAIAVADEMKAEIQKHEKQLLQNLSDEDISSLRRMLKTIYRNLE